MLGEPEHPRQRQGRFQRVLKINTDGTIRRNSVGQISAIVDLLRWPGHPMIFHRKGSVVSWVKSFDQPEREIPRGPLFQ